jgi:hypothetical protein
MPVNPDRFFLERLLPSLLSREDHAVPRPDLFNYNGHRNTSTEPAALSDIRVQHLLRARRHMCLSFNHLVDNNPLWSSSWPLVLHHSGQAETSVMQSYHRGGDHKLLQACKTAGCQARPLGPLHGILPRPGGVSGQVTMAEYATLRQGSQHPPVKRYRVQVKQTERILPLSTLTHGVFPFEALVNRTDHRSVLSWVPRCLRCRSPRPLNITRRVDTLADARHY